jgi:hypothetical protein
VDSLIFKLHGHSSSLVKVECVPHTPEIISLDSDGIVKVWDIRNFSCVQVTHFVSVIKATKLRDWIANNYFSLSLA